MQRRSVLVLAIVVFMAIVSNVHATDVGGIIDVNTTWTLVSSPYNLTANVQVASGVTLTIEPAVVINGQHNRLEFWGTLNAIGTDVSPIIFDDIFIWGRGSTAIIIIQFADIATGKIYVEGDTLILQDSILTDAYSPSQGVHIWSDSIDCYIERNIFQNTVDIDVGRSADTYIYNNVFFGQTSDYAIISGVSSGLIVKYNSYLSTDRMALQLQSSGSMTATENYWNTTNTSIIDSMIYDRNDDLAISNYIVYAPILTVPHPNTPIFLPDQLLTVQTEPNDVNTVTPSVGEHIVSGLVDVSAELFIDCPDVYKFDHWIGDVADVNSGDTTVFMDSGKTITAVFVDDRKCGDECHPYPAGDIDKNCFTDFNDFALFCQSWLECTKPECD